MSFFSEISTHLLLYIMISETTSNSIYSYFSTAFVFAIISSFCKILTLEIISLWLSPETDPPFPFYPIISIPSIVHHSFLNTIIASIVIAIDYFFNPNLDFFYTYINIKPSLSITDNWTGMISFYIGMNLFSLSLYSTILAILKEVGIVDTPIERIK